MHNSENISSVHNDAKQKSHVHFHFIESPSLSAAKAPNKPDPLFPTSALENYGRD